MAYYNVIGNVSDSGSVHVLVTGGGCLGTTEINPCEEREIDSPGE